MDFAARNPGTMPAPCCYELTSGTSEQTKYGARFDAGIDHEGGALRAIDFGVKYVKSDRDVNNRDWTVNEPSPAASFAADTSILSGYFPGFPGHYPYPIPNVNHNELTRRFAELTSAPGALDAASDICASGSTALGVTTNNNCNTLSGTEEVSSVYALGRFGSDVLGFNVGIRYEDTAVDNSYWVRVFDNSGAEVMGHWGSNSSSFSKVLPSAFVTYRPDDSAVYRAGIWTSYTRPPFFQLGGNSSSSFDPSTNTTTVRMGNPDLKAIEAVNLDLSGNWRTDDGGYYGLGLFYKQLSNYIYDSGTGYINAATVSAGLTQTIQPRNGGDGDVWGIELEGQQNFSAMPAPFNKISIGGNVTVQRSKVDIGTPWGGNQRIQNAPELTGNLGVYYNDGALSLDVLYHYAGEYVSSYDVLGKGGSWDNLWVAPVRSLDLHAGYDLGIVQFDFSIANLLDDYTYWSHVGKDSIAISDVIQSGRTVVASLRYAF
jgi:TonB-dependent receptor